MADLRKKNRCHVTSYWQAIILLCENWQFGASLLIWWLYCYWYCVYNLSCPRTDKETHRHINKRNDKWLFALCAFWWWLWWWCASDYLLTRSQLLFIVWELGMSWVGSVILWVGLGLGQWNGPTDNSGSDFLLHDAFSICWQKSRHGYTVPVQDEEISVGLPFCH